MRAPLAPACRPAPVLSRQPVCWLAKAETEARCIATASATGTGPSGSTRQPVRSGSRREICPTATASAWPASLARSRSCGDLLAGETLGAQDARDFSADIVAQSAIKREACRVGWIARVWQVDRLDGLDRRARPRGHGYDAVGQEDGFPDVVGNKHDRAAGRAPDTVQLALQHFTRLCIDSTQRLVHQHDSRRRDQK